jgi:hypothetical protein
LQAAQKAGHRKVLQLLLEHGADSNAVEVGGAESQDDEMELGSKIGSS